MQKSFKLKLKNAKQIICISRDKLPYRIGEQLQQIQIVSNFSILVDHQGKIYRIDQSEKIEQEFKEAVFQKQIDCKNFIITPGFVDSHTHALFLGDRSKQFEMKLQGKNYIDIYNEGLGIRFTTDNIKKSEISELENHLEKYINKMIRLGTTTVEIKSGYGLDTENQIKMLRAIHNIKLKYSDKISIIGNYCGAHAIPKGKTEEQQTLDIINNQIPALKKAIDNNQISPELIDVFCQKKFFQTESTIQILNAGKQIGLIPHFHGDELTNIQSGSIGALVKARGISHLQYLSDQSIKKMAQNKIVAVLLPTTQNIQKLPIPPIKKMRQSNVIFALGSDFCPNAFCYNMCQVMHYACVNYRMTPKQALIAATLNSAYSLNRENEIGSIEQGKYADLLLVDAQSWHYLIYSFGDSIISKVIKRGKVVFE